MYVLSGEDILRENRVITIGAGIRMENHFKTSIK